MKFDPLNRWSSGAEKPLIIAGPCSAETEDQLLETTKAIKELDISIIRAGIWKPRTRPNNFEGIGLEGLKWIQNVKKELGVSFAVEVATPQHVEQVLKHDIDILWIGARSTVNPFTVQDIADALKGVDIPVLIKNPINPDLELWLGAIERIYNAGITKIGAIHRGFSSHQKSKYRNMPAWQLPIELKRRLPNLPMICDPSHIAGDSKMIYDLCQKALDMDYDGLMIETHRDPANAWSDAKQQVNPLQLHEILQKLKVRKSNSNDETFNSRLEDIRHQIDQADREILECLANRMSLVKKIGDCKKEENVAVFQVDRWNDIFKSRAEWGESFGLDPKYITELYKIIHNESIRRQTDLMNNPTVPTDNVA
ncbi:MAG: bifunctional 3-deoxy-7-phosphoheptulonate synthase/chorismate mutase type II [Bacteroidota bacterium]|nr:bifunctional 3-deoxy-7-phosphoheptulonate synthase/chorismate mutase type II [Bacteroidota bacterium]